MPSGHTAVIQPFILHLESKNQGLEKLRSTSDLRKISGPVHLNFFSVNLSFFSVCHLNFFHVYGINLKKKLRCAGPEIFLRFETDLYLSRPWFSEIKVQNKWLSMNAFFSCNIVTLVSTYFETLLELFGIETYSIFIIYVSK